MSAEVFDNSLETSFDTPETEQLYWNPQDFEATAQVLARSRAEELADAENLGVPEDILTGMDETTTDVESVIGSDVHKGSGIDDAQDSLNIENIETQIAEIQEKIEELEADADNLTEEQWIELDELYQRLAELENQQSLLIEQQIAEEKSETAQQEAVIEEENDRQAEQEVAINTLDKEILDGFTGLSGFLDANVRAQFSGIDALLAPADPLVAKLKNGETLTQDENDTLETITADTIAYLKQPHHRQELVAISRNLQMQSPQEYQAFKTFLISQDKAFSPIFEEIDTHVDDSFEATISAALPSAPDSGNLSSGFVSQLDDGTQVKVESGADGIVRSLDLAGTNYPIETEVQDVNLAAAEEERATVLNEIGPKKQIAEYARQLIADNPDKDFAELKKELKSTLGTEQFVELGIDGFADRESAMQELDSKIQEYNDQIEAAQNAFRKIAQEAIRKTRESYERKDKLVKQSLRLVYDTGFSMIPRGVTDEIIETINKRPADYGFQTEIHLDEGQIWFNSHTDNGDEIQCADKTRFAEMMNIMLGAEFVDVTAIERGMTGVPNRGNFATRLREAGMQNSGAAATALQRLRDRNANTSENQFGAQG